VAADDGRVHVAAAAQDRGGPPVQATGALRTGRLRRAGLLGRQHRSRRYGGGAGSVFLAIIFGIVVVLNSAGTIFGNIF
jgi:hypothetical protein